jgi:Lrp/AsnC family transcriptional regulator, regulator for asnA, asnC and gidA
MLDDLDKNIIEILNNDGRANNKDIAAALSVSEGTIRNRINKLRETGLLTISGLISPDDVDSRQLVFLGINVAKSKNLLKKSKQISKLENVLSVSITSGRYDMIVEVWVDVKYGLIDFLSKQLAEVTEIAATESFLVMKSCNKYIAVNN